jgi:hypothetical protein
MTPASYRSGGDETRALTPTEIERVVAALQKATDTFRPTRFETLAYVVWRRMLAVSAILLPLVVLGTVWAPHIRYLIVPVALGFVVLIVTTLISLFLLAVNAPLFFRIAGESRNLRRVGLLDISSDVWRSGGDWTRATRRGAYGLVAALYAFCAWLTYRTGGVPDGWAVGLPILLSVTAANIIAALVFQRKKEEVEIVRSADRVRAALGHSRQDGEHLEIPVSLLETAARIEGAQIARERAEAVFTSQKEPRRYAVVYEAKAAQARLALPLSLRIALEDLVQSVAARPDESVSPAELVAVRSTDSRVGIQYTCDPEAQHLTVHGVSAILGAATRKGDD